MIDKFVAVDIETTGLDPKKDRIIEIGAVRVENGEIVEEYQSFVNPQRKLPPFITELTGIREEMLLDAPKSDKAVKEFLEFLGEDDLLGHHLIFDFSFLKRNAVNLGYTLERKGIDTLKIARIFLGFLEKKSLTALCKYYKIENHNAHRAKEDAVASAVLYKKLADDFYKEGQTEAIFTPQPLIYKVRREAPITKAQIRYLTELSEYHKIPLEVEIKSLTKNEASRQIDFLILHYGKLK